jgi:hypothetical protein
MASRPAKLQTRSAPADPTANHPCGSNGRRFAARASGTDSATEPTSSTSSTPASANRARALTESPAAFITVTANGNAAAVAVVVIQPPPVAADTYAPPNSAAAGAPTGTAK